MFRVPDALQHEQDLIGEEFLAQIVAAFDDGRQQLPFAVVAVRRRPAYPRHLLLVGFLFQNKNTSVSISAPSQLMPFKAIE